MTKRDHKPNDDCQKDGLEAPGQARMNAMDLLGKYQRPGRSLDDIMREKHQETDEEERRWEEAHPALRNPKD